MDNLFEQFAAISKAGAYDAIQPEYKRLQEENVRLKGRVKFLEELINEYTLKMKANLSGPKVDQFLKVQLSDTEKEIEREMKDHDDLKGINI